MKNLRIGIRIEPELRQKLEQLIQKGTFKSISEVIRKALKQFLENNRKNDSG